MIEFSEVSIAYQGTPVLREVSLHIGEGELALAVGRTGSGKSTLLGAVNGLVPHFTGGRLAGRVTVAGRDTRTHRPRELAATVGVVGQDPVAGFVTDSVEEELAYGMEQLGVTAAAMRKRVEETMDLLGIAELRDRPLRALSGGQQQRVAIGAVLAAGPRVLVLDEPTSALDPGAAEEVLAAVTRLVHDLGITVLIAEHRLERVLQYADRVLTVHDGRVSAAEPAQAMRSAPIAPPVVALGRLAGWDPLPLSVRDARRRAPELRAELPGAPVPAPIEPGAETLTCRDVVVRYGGTVAVREVSLSVAAGETVALMGRNGSGKSSLLWALQGSGPRHSGAVTIRGTDPAGRKPVPRRVLAALVPQSPADLLYLQTVGEELATDRAGEILDELAPGIDPDSHPRDLSEGQRLALALAVQLAAEPAVLLLDEPTRGLDYPGKHRLTALVRAFPGAVLIATHDVEFAAETCDRAVVLADGEVVADGPTADVVTSSPLFAPQVAKILGGGWLTVGQVAGALR
ncbi:ABC transporter ATP-binding protein [Amycolatopsis rubida]|uniref:Energy-coupling factor transport system ATP-binding protein n=1 Tax=Amycolatopsis rubida TaxID=112413 RepID=A0A1I5S5Q7_9PSEU|nr:ABC transporter ATP-binding protein [Amycolatopsis rubida]SFP66014.1 energy-coupling factor transport system ATP-binding protein [Amycolatopsis rubida]